MTVEERLAEWLQQTTPEPPRAVTVDDLSIRSRGRGWLPVLAAACVVLIVLVAVAIANRHVSRHDEPPVAPTSQGQSHSAPTPSRTASPTTPPPSSAAPALAFAAWGAHIVGSTPLTRDSLVSDGTRLFALADRGLVRVDPGTGAILATAQVSTDQLQVRSPVLAGGRVWALLRNGPNRLRLESFSTTSLAPTGHGLVLAFPHGLGTDWPAITGDSGTIYVAAGNRVFVVDARADSVVRRLDVNSNRITALAPATGRIFVGTRYDGIFALDPVTAAETPLATAGGDVVAGLVPAAQGLWVHTASGMSDSIAWYSYADLSREVIVSGGGGGAYPTVAVVGPTAWLGGPQNLVCADPNTAAVRAEVKLQRGEKQEDIGGIAVVGGQVFATGEGEANGSYLVELHPPTACR